MVKANGKLLAVVDDRVKNHTEQISKVMETVVEIKDILIKGEGKIKRNYMMILDHKEEVKQKHKNTLVIASIIATIIASVLGSVIAIVLN